MRELNFIIERFLVDKDDEDTMVTQLMYAMEHEGSSIILEGDYYHDRIDDKITGFFEALDFIGVKYSIEHILWDED